MATFDLFRNKGFLRNSFLHRLESIDPTSRACLAHATLTALLLTAGFLAMKNYQGYISLSDLPLFYVCFLMVGVFVGLMRLHSVKGLEYVEGISAGIRISSLAVCMFGLFVSCYLLFNQEALYDIIERRAYGAIVNRVTVCSLVLFEGWVAGLVISFGVMQYFKRF